MLSALKMVSFSMFMRQFADKHDYITPTERVRYHFLRFLKARQKVPVKHAETRLISLLSRGRVPFIVNLLVWDQPFGCNSPIP